MQRVNQHGKAFDNAIAVSQGVGVITAAMGLVLRKGMSLSVGVGSVQRALNAAEWAVSTGVLSRQVVIPAAILGAYVGSQERGGNPLLNALKNALLTVLAIYPVVLGLEVMCGLLAKLTGTLW